MHAPAWEQMAVPGRSVPIHEEELYEYIGCV